MSDLMKPENRGKIAFGAGGIAGGIVVLAVSSFIAHLAFLPALVIGGAVLAGSWYLFQKPKSALTGMLGIVAGVVIAASALEPIKFIASGLLTLGGIGMIAAGAWAIYRVFKSRRT